MAKINKTHIYPYKSNPSPSDYLVGTDSQAPNRQTKSFRISDVIALISNPSYQYLDNRILSGSVKWIPDIGYDYTSTNIVYRWIGTEYTAPRRVLMTLPNIPVVDGNKKVYVFAVDADLNEIVIIEGQEGPNATEPNVDFTKQIRICAVTVEAGEDKPTGVGYDLVYDENTGEPTEWDLQDISTESTIQFDFDVDYNTGSKCISLKGVGNDEGFYAKNNELIKVSEFSSISFYLKNSVVNPNTPYLIKLILRKGIGGNAVALLFIDSSTSLFDFGNTEDWQLVNVPKEIMEVTNVSDDFDVIEMRLYQEGDNELDNDLVLIDTIGVNFGTENPSLKTSWIGLSDTYESSYNKKRGFISRVTNKELGLQLVNPVLIPLNGFLVRKPDLSTSNIDELEEGDEVYFKKITNNGDPITLFGHTFNGGDDQLLENYTKNQTIDF